MIKRHSKIEATVLNEKIYVCGRNVFGPILVEVYDPSLNQWSLLAPMNRITESAKLAPYNGKLFAIGRRFHVIHFPDNIEDFYPTEIYDPVLNQWSDGPLKPHNEEIYSMGMIPFS